MSYYLPFSFERSIKAFLALRVQDVKDSIQAAKTKNAKHMLNKEPHGMDWIGLPWTPPSSNQ
jgi:hypothetical protein